MISTTNPAAAATADPVIDHAVDHQTDRKPHQRSPEGVTERYGDARQHAVLEANAVKLRAFARAFGLTPTQIARSTGVSRSFVSRIVSEKDPFLGNDAFYRRLEQALGSLVQNRSCQVFAVEPVAADETNGFLR